MIRTVLWSPPLDSASKIMWIRPTAMCHATNSKEAMQKIIIDGLDRSEVTHRQTFCHRNISALIWHWTDRSNINWLNFRCRFQLTYSNCGKSKTKKIFMATRRNVRFFELQSCDCCLSYKQVRHLYSTYFSTSRRPMSLKFT